MSEQSPTPFQFEGRNVRLIERDGETWFAATDVARELGYETAKDMVRHLDEDEKGRHTVPTLGGDQEITIVSEPGVYRAIVQRRANKKHDASLSAKIARFQRFVFHDVLPSIRATGSYNPAPIAPALPDFTNPAVAARSWAEQYEAREVAEKIVAQQTAEIATLAPKAERYDRFLSADGLISLQDTGRALQCHPNLFIKALFPKYCFRDGTRIVARQEYVVRGLFQNKSFDAPNGKVYLHARMTAKGLDYFSTRVPDYIRSRPALSASHGEVAAHV